MKEKITKQITGWQDFPDDCHDSTLDPGIYHDDVGGRSVIWYVIKSDFGGSFSRATIPTPLNHTASQIEGTYLQTHNEQGNQYKKHRTWFS